MSTDYAKRIRALGALRRSAANASKHAWVADTKVAHEAAMRAHDAANRAAWNIIIDRDNVDTKRREALRGIPEGHTKEEAKHKLRIDELGREAYARRRSTWATRDVMAHGRPPETLNVLDEHGGFTAETSLNGSLWRPGSILKRGYTGKLISFNRDSFFQNNDNVTLARYKVPGYKYQAMVWFDNTTGHRVA